MAIPIILSKKTKALVVGGGNVALRKVRWLLECGAEVTLESPVIHEELYILAPNSAINIIEREYLSRELDYFELVFACTDNAQVNELIRQDANKCASLVNVADNPQACDFTVPATFSTDNISATFSCNGLPALAATLRDNFASSLPENINVIASAIHQLRREIIQNEPEQSQRAISIRKLCSRQAIESCAGLSPEQIRQQLLSML